MFRKWKLCEDASKVVAFVMPEGALCVHLNAVTYTRGEMVDLKRTGKRSFELRGRAPKYAAKYPQNYVGPSAECMFCFIPEEDDRFLPGESISILTGAGLKQLEIEKAIAIELKSRDEKRRFSF